MALQNTATTQEYSVKSGPQTRGLLRGLTTAFEEARRGMWTDDLTILR